MQYYKVAEENIATKQCTEPIKQMSRNVSKCLSVYDKNRKEL